MKIDLKKAKELVPVVVQHAQSGKVLMLGYMNQEALDLTIASGKVTFFSRSKNRIWVKGETSGNYLNVKGISTDCDSDAFLIKAQPDGPSCHLGTESCFSAQSELPLSFLSTLEEIVAKRRLNSGPTSYTRKLFDAGCERIAQKVGEEAIEVLIAALKSDKAALKDEAADLLFHLLVLLEDRGVALSEVVSVLLRRHQRHCPSA